MWDVVGVIAALYVVAAALVVAYSMGEARGEARARRQRARNGRWPNGMPVVSLDWVGEVPVAVLECDPRLASDVAAWLEAVKEGTVLRV